MIVILCIALVVLPAAGFIYAATLGPDYDPGQGYLALGLCVAGFVVPLVLGAALAGEAIRRGGGLVGFLFAAGLIGAPTASLLGIQWLAAACLLALVASVVLFFVIRSRSTVPTLATGPTAPNGINT
jgi:hypothetical protein